MATSRPATILRMLHQDSIDCSSRCSYQNYDPAMLMAVMHTDDKDEC